MRYRWAFAIEPTTGGKRTHFCSFVCSNISLETNKHLRTHKNLFVCHLYYQLEPWENIVHVLCIVYSILASNQFSSPGVNFILWNICSLFQKPIVKLPNKIELWSLFSKTVMMLCCFCVQYPIAQRKWFFGVFVFARESFSHRKLHY